MRAFFGTAAWLLSSLGVALLVCSLVLVPEGPALGQFDPPPGQSLKCKVQDGCNTILDGVNKECRMMGTGCTNFDCQKTTITDCKDCTCNNTAGEVDCKCQLPPP